MAFVLTFIPLRNCSKRAALEVCIGAEPCVVGFEEARTFVDGETNGSAPLLRGRPFPSPRGRVLSAKRSVRLAHRARAADPLLGNDAQDPSALR